MDNLIDIARFKARVDMARNSQDFSERLKRIRASLDKINSLMYELRAMGERDRLHKETDDDA
jgi:hypothetical protein